MSLQKGDNMNFKSLRDAADVTVIFDTDMCTDVDDVGALYLFLAAAKKYGFRTGGIAVNVNGEGEYAAIKAILGETKSEEIPVGVYDGENSESGNRSPYVDFLAGQYVGKRECITASELYENVLNTAEDGKVVIVSVGFFNNLNRARKRNPTLFDKKVSAVVAMAGRFDVTDGFAEFNIRQFPVDAREFIEQFEGEIIFGGFEIGYRVITDLNDFATKSLLTETYNIFTAGRMRRESWDPLTVDFAINGESEIYSLSERGKVTLLDDLSTCFTICKGGNCRYIILNRPYDESGRHISDEVKKSCLFLLNIQTK